MKKRGQNMGKQSEHSLLYSANISDDRDRLKYNAEEIIVAALKAGAKTIEDLIRTFEDFKRRGLTYEDLKDFHRALRIMIAFDVIRTDGERVTLNEKNLFGPILQLAEHLSSMINVPKEEESKVVEVKVEK